uniref:Uncharacterized protein n=1 Tax=Neolamprologus brichardi TaxID=32507 RepID=A0A3Q4I9P2_NEOBR
FKLICSSGGERMIPQCVASSVKHGGGSVIIWSCLAGSKVGELYMRGADTLRQNVNSKVTKLRIQK